MRHLLDTVTGSRHHAEAKERAMIETNRAGYYVTESPALLDLQTYVLPDGREVEVDATAAKGAAYITFTLAGGKVVVARRKA